MPDLSSYALQYANVSYAAWAASTYDLLITEGAPRPRPGSNPQLTDGQVAALVAQGRLVVGYVDVGITDTNRGYWNPAWTSNGDDLGVVQPGAPSWLQTQPTNAYGVLVDFRENAWQQIVIDQAVDLVQRGYSGVFLDDIGTYYTLGNGVVADIRAMATEMCEFIARIDAAISAINPNAFVVANCDPYLPTNVTLDARGTAAAAAYFAAVDAHLLENQSAAAIDYAVATFPPGETRLILESDGTPAYNFTDSWARGILSTAPATYNGPGTFAYPVTGVADTIIGGVGPNQISALGGGDHLEGRGGADTLTGGDGDDFLIGGLGADALIGGNGTDWASYEDNFGSVAVYLSTGLGYGNAAQGDTLSGIENLRGSSFNDYLVGESGANRLEGGDGDDTLIGWLGADILVGGNGSDWASYEENWGGVFVNLTNGTGSNNAAQGDTYSGIENARGSIFADTLAGDNNANILAGGGGNDVLIGSGGADSFQFDSALNAGSNVDSILDFTSGSDRILLAHSIFAAIGTGTLAASAFALGTAATTAAHRVIYDSSTGSTYYDGDGVGGDGPILFAVITAGLSIAASDFVVV